MIYERKTGELGLIEKLLLYEGHLETEKISHRLEENIWRTHLTKRSYIQNIQRALKTQENKQPN